MWVEISFILLLCIIYFLFYVEIKVNKSNELYFFDKEMTRRNLQNEMYLKLPFYFNGKHLNEPYSKSILEKVDKKKHHYEQYKKSYDEISLLEPRTRFKATHDIYYIHKKKSLPLLMDTCSINFYIVKSGQVKVTFIHPKFKEHFVQKDTICDVSSKVDYIQNHKSFLSMIASENTIIYVPNQWIVYVENEENKTSILDIIHYSTMCNQFIEWGKNNIIKKQKTV